MFDFQKLFAYQKARIINKKIQMFLKSHKTSPFLKNQLHRASISMVINIAEGTGKTSKKDRTYFYVISRGSVYECASLFDLLIDENTIDHLFATQCQNELFEVQKILSGLIKSLTS